MKPQRLVFFLCLLITLTITLTISLGGCAPPAGAPADAAGDASLWVTRDFGAEDLFCSEVSVMQNKSVLAHLQEHLQVETEYGGGFVNAINGLRSGYSGKAGKDRHAVDWFYYVNGILTDQGAAAYVPVPGNVIWWDFRSWGDLAFTPAVVGAFPQPFSGGSGDKDGETLILAGGGCGKWAEQLACFLEEAGAQSVEVAPYLETSVSSRSRMVLVVAFWEELCRSSFWEGIQQHRERTGWFAELTPGRFYPLDEHGRRKNEGFGEKTGAILATGTGLGDPYPLWLVTATDAEGLAASVDALVSGPQRFAKAMGALVVDGGIIKLPMQSAAGRGDCRPE